MNLKTYQADIKKIIEQRNGYLVLSLGLLILCLVLSILVISFSGRERIILVTPNMKNEIWVSNHSASAEYFSRMTLFLSELNFNVTPDNIDFQQDLLLRYVEPSYYKILKPQLVAKADRIKKDHITTMFFPVDIKVNSKKSEAFITGDLKAYVGDAVLSTNRITYRFAFRFNSFTPLITQLEEVTHA